MLTHSTPNYDELLKIFTELKGQPQAGDAEFAKLAKDIERVIEAGIDMMKKDVGNRDLLINGIEDCRRMARLLERVEEYRTGLAKGRRP
jgi:hypothetical protein